jgi:hypothetical protein
MESPKMRVDSPATVAPAWEKVARLCRGLQPRVRTLAATALAASRFPPAAGGDLAIPDHELEANGATVMRLVLEGLAQRRGPAGELLLVVARLAAERAAQGVPIDALSRSIRAGFETLWDAIAGEALSGDPQLLQELLVASTLLWRSFDELSTVVSDSYRAVLGGGEVALATVKQNFLHQVLNGEPDSPAVRELATSLGFDPAATFTALCFALSATDPFTRISEPALALQARSPVRLIPRSHALLLVVQGARHAMVAKAVQDAAPGIALGIGVSRTGLDGARVSIGDADRALALARLRGGGAVRFAAEWPAAVVGAERERLEDLWAAVEEVAVRRPFLAASVRAFARARFSATTAARSLHVHPNTLAYRLDRWHQLTGWDPRTFDGLQNSMLVLAQQPGYEAGSRSSR